MWDALGASHSRPPSCVALFPPKRATGGSAVCTALTPGLRAVSQIKSSLVCLECMTEIPLRCPQRESPKCPGVIEWICSEPCSSNVPTNHRALPPPGPVGLRSASLSGALGVIFSSTARHRGAKLPVTPPPGSPAGLECVNGASSRGVGGEGAAGRGGSEETGLPRKQAQLRPSCQH